MGKITNFTDSERFETHKTDCVLKFYKDKESYHLGFQVDIENTGESALGLALWKRHLRP